MKPSSLCIFAVALVFTSMAYADSISIVLDSSTLSGAPGDVLTFSGIIANTAGDPVYLNSDTVSLPGFDSSNIDDSAFFGMTPLFLDANSTSGDLGLFSISLPGSFADGTYDGSFSIFGGPTPGSTDLLSIAIFNVQVASDMSPVPEPGMLTVLAAAAGMVVAGSRLWRRPAC